MHFSIFACEDSSFFKDVLLVLNSQMDNLCKINIDNKKSAHSEKTRFQRVKEFDIMCKTIAKPLIRKYHKLGLSY